MHPDVYKRPLLFILAGLILGLYLFYSPTPARQDVSRFIPQKEVTLSGRVESFAISKNGSQNVWMKVSRVNGFPARGRVYARIKDFSPQWKDTLQLTGRLQAPYGVSLPGNFNWQQYLAQKQTFAEIKASQATILKPAAWPWRIIRAVRQDILRVFNENLPAELARVAGGILLGERGELGADLYTAFQDSGAIHLLVASGGNVGFVTLLTLGLGVWVGLRRRTLLVTALFTAGLYTLIAGADAPLLRAYLMAASACVGYFLGRNSGVFQGLLLSCLIILLANPAAVFDTGFQMSFLATLSIIIFLNNYRVPGNWPKVLRFFAQIFLATLASQLVLLPVFTNVFYKISLTGLVSNMLLVPFASGLMVLGFAYYVLTVFHAGVVLQVPFGWGLELFEYVVQFFASFRFSSIQAAAWNGGSVIAYYILLFWISQLPKRAFAKRLFLPCIITALLAWGTGYAWSSLPRVYVLSEWNKHAVIVKTDKHNCLIFNNGLEDEKLKRALFSLGFSKAEQAVSLDVFVPVSTEVARQVRAAFTDVWPGEIWPFYAGEVKAVWGIHQTKDGRFWQDTGYHGTRSGNISYCVEKNGRELCVGNAGRFIMLPSGEILTAQRNKTVWAYW